MKKLIDFCRQVYSPGVHLSFAAAWYLGLHAGLSLNHSRAFRLDLSSLVAVLTLLVVLLYLRIIDEIKDFPYDQTFNPDRPLVRGTIAFRDLTVPLWILGILTLAMNIFYGNAVLGLLAAELAYAYLLRPLDRLSRPVRENMLINLLFTYPVNILLSFYVLLLDGHLWRTKCLKNDILVIAAFACAFLYYEFARKITWPRLERPGRRSYSDVLGMAPALIIANGWGLMAAGIVVFLYQTWIPTILLAPLLWGLFGLKAKKTMTVSGMIFIALFYGVFVGLGILAQLDQSPRVSKTRPVMALFAGSSGPAEPGLAAAKACRGLRPSAPRERYRDERIPPGNRPGRQGQGRLQQPAPGSEERLHD